MRWTLSRKDSQWACSFHVASVQSVASVAHRELADPVSLANSASSGSCAPGTKHSSPVCAEVETDADADADEKDARRTVISPLSSNAHPQRSSSSDLVVSPSQPGPAAVFGFCRCLLAVSRLRVE